MIPTSTDLIRCVVLVTDWMIENRLDILYRDEYRVRILRPTFQSKLASKYLIRPFIIASPGIILAHKHDAPY